ncbi:hypothetical protein SELMODRAFT_418423 [Selaginella moellendorffii]|uniref:DUF4378 domain-containing protein n=1 Tax=Selaginella moellendorffii TaxID=88036 RepID=D8S5N2_SELML|nr:uncharacterized protein LOC9653856 [Selaginella moellendorffii]EFJ20204.1 hypothetical protein SELMODRAFT_418423 [Selaginella moellendorffii]|eukprot:XP_002978757.1 uncharacterized protein LOC9653856 [Selaginella moellendorffii]
MDESPRRPNAASSKHARRLFAANREEKSVRRHSSSDGQARRKLLLGAPEEESLNSSFDDAAIHEPNVVARLMGLDSLPVGAKIKDLSAVSSSSGSDGRSPPVMILRENGGGGERQQLQLQELLRIKEPLLLRELLREEEDQYRSLEEDHQRQNGRRGPSLVEKFAGLMRRARVPAVEHEQEEGEKSKKKKGEQKSGGSKVSPIKSPSKKKRGLVAEAAVKVLPTDDHRPPQHQNLDTGTADKKPSSRRKLSLNRSSSEPTLGSSSSSTSRRLAKISESIRQRFGGFSSSSDRLSSNSSSSSSVSKSTKNKVSDGGNLVRSKSDLGLQQQHEGGGGLGWSEIRRLHKQQKQRESDQLIIKSSNEREEDHLPQRASFSPTAKLVTMKNSTSSSHGILSYTTNRLFGNQRGKEKESNRTRTKRTSSSDGSGKDHSSTSATSGTARPSKSEASSSLMRALLRRSRNIGAGTTKQAARSFQSVGRKASASSLSSRQGLADDISLSSVASSSCAGVTPPRFCEELLSDDSSSVARSEGSGSSPTNSNCGNYECSRSSRSEGGQPSPVSVLEPPFVDEMHSSPLDSGGEDSPDAKLRTSSTGSDSILSAILDISRIRCIDLSSIGISDSTASSRHSFEEETAYIDDVLRTSQLLCDQEEKLLSSPAVVAATRRWLSQDSPVASRVFSIIETTMTSKSHGRGSLQARKLLFDCVEEAVRSRFGCCKSWYLGVGSVRLAGVGMPQVGAEVQQQISDWKSMETLSTDELVEKDMSVGAGKWMDWNGQVELIAEDVESSILRTMIDELVCEWSGP